MVQFAHSLRNKVSMKQVNSVSVSTNGMRTAYGRINKLVVQFLTVFPAKPHFCQFAGNKILHEYIRFAYEIL